MQAQPSCTELQGSNRQAAVSHRWAACLPTHGKERWARVPAAARGSLLRGSWGFQPLHACNPCICPPDEKEESILGSIPLLSFRVAAVQPSDNISRKHTFKVSAWRGRSTGTVLGWR